MLISICMATYNGGKFIKEQMDSILAQEFKENPDAKMEVIVSDDGSTDDTLQIVEAYHDPRIRIVHHKHQHKYKYYKTLQVVTDNFVNAINNSRGEYIFFTDQDDVWYPWKVDKQLTQLRRLGGVNCCAFDTTFDLGGPPHKIIGQVRYSADLPFFSLKPIGIYGFSMALARSELRYILPIPSMVAAHDTYIGHAALWRHCLHFIDQPCALHRYMKGSSSALKKKHDPLIVKILFRLNLYRSVIWRWIRVR